MAKLNGPIRITGTIGDFNFYNMTGSDHTYVRKKKKFDKKKFNTDPAFEVVRELSTEFAGCVAIARNFYHAAKPPEKIGDYNYFSKLMSLFNAVQQKETVNESGKRGIPLSLHRTLLEGFSYNKTTLLDEVLRPALTCDIDRTEGSAAFQIPLIEPGINFKAIEDAGYYRFHLRLLAIPDYIFDDASGKFIPAIPALPLPVAQVTAYQPVAASAAATVVKLKLENWTNLPNVSIAGVGMLQYAKTGADGQPKLFRKSSVGKILRVV